MTTTQGGTEAAAAEEAALLGLEPAPPHGSTRYGPHPSQVIDHYLPPPGSVAPALRVTILHGGFWREAYDRTHLSPLAAELARRGMAVALAEYRRVGGGGGWPETAQDVARAVGAAWDGSGDRTPTAPAHVLLGHSAGGHLALWAAARDAPPLTRVVAVAPVADLATAHELGLSNGAVAAFLGGPDRLAAHLPEADPMRLPPPRVPVTILHGTADPDVPPALSRRYAAQAPAVLRELPGGGHYGPLIPGSPTFPDLLEALRGARHPQDGRQEVSTTADDAPACDA